MGLVPNNPVGGNVERFPPFVWLPVVVVGDDDEDSLLSVIGSRSCCNGVAVADGSCCWGCLLEGTRVALDGVVDALALLLL